MTLLAPLPLQICAADVLSLLSQRLWLHKCLLSPVPKFPSHCQTLATSGCSSRECLGGDLVEKQLL